MKIDDLRDFVHSASIAQFVWYANMKKQLRLLLQIILSALLLIVGVVTFNTLSIKSHQIEVQPLPRLQFDSRPVIDNLSAAVKLQTISSADDAQLNADQFKQLHQLLRDRFPAAHARLRHETVNDLSLLFTWEGSDPNAPGILILAHQDVVAIAPGTEAQWSFPPFSGAVKDAYVWGRGAWDDKGNLMAQMEALEMLIKSGFQPQRTVYLAFGADEEVLGVRGAAQIAALLKQRAVKLDIVLDEGLLITHGMLPGLNQAAALIGVAEKGYLSVQIQVKAEPGHSSMPPAPGHSAIAKLSRVLDYLDQHPRPSQIQGVARELFSTVAPEMHGLNRVALSNLWLFSGLVKQNLEKSDATRALLHTTTALTMSHAGNKENVLPGVAEATINFRLLPGDDIEQIVQELRQQIQQVISEKEFDIRPLPKAVNASKVSASNSAQYKLLSRTIREVFPGTIVAPGLMLGATDSIKFEELSEHIFKFSPVHASSEDLARFHGTDERMSIENYLDMIRFYHRFISQAALLQRVPH